MLVIRKKKIRNWSGLLARLSKIILTTSRRFKERELDCTSIQKQNQFLADGYRVKFATSSEIIEQIKKTWDQDSKISERDLLADLKDVEILIIDDFGAEKNSAWINDKFYQIVNYRYINKLVTIYTSNYTENEVQYNERISSRIKECSYSVQFPEESVRDHIYEQRNNEMIKKILEGEV